LQKAQPRASAPAPTPLFPRKGVLTQEDDLAVRENNGLTSSAMDSSSEVVEPVKPIESSIEAEASDRDIQPIEPASIESTPVRVRIERRAEEETDTKNSENQ